MKLKILAISSLLFLGLGGFFFTNFQKAIAATTVCFPYQGCTGISTATTTDIGYVLGVSSTNPLVYKLLPQSASSGSSTSTFQQVTNFGNTTTNSIQFAGGTSTANFVVSGPLTSLNTTTIYGQLNLPPPGGGLGFTTTLDNTSVTANQATFNSLILQYLTVQQSSTLNTLSFVSATGTNLSVASLTINGQTICQTDGTNCPATTTPTLQQVTTAGSVTTLPITFAGGTSTAGLSLTSATATNFNSTNLTFGSATGTNLNVSVISGGTMQLTSLTSTNANITTLTGSTAVLTSVTSTNIFATLFNATNGTFIGLTTTNFSAVLGAITTLSSTNLTATNVTSTNHNSTNYTGTNISVANVTSTNMNATAYTGTTAVLTSVTTTNFSAALEAVTAATFGNATSTNWNVSGLTNLANTTITNVTTTNLRVSGTSTLASTTINGQQVCLGDGTNCVAAAPNVQAFTVSGTWNKPASCNQLRIYTIGGGGGGGSGRTGASGSRNGGNGGSAGGFSQVTLPGSFFPSSVVVTVGVGGQGADVQDFPSTTGFSGFDGTTSSFGNFVLAGGGKGGVGGGITTGIPTPGGAGLFLGGQGGFPINNVTSTAGASSSLSASGGGAGGSINSSNIIKAAGDGGLLNFFGNTSTLFVFSIGAPGLPGYSFGTTSNFIGGGGTGGGSATGTTAAGRGGNGGLYGAGGGGGGAADNAYGASGQGGNGAQGVVVATCF